MIGFSPRYATNATSPQYTNGAAPPPGRYRLGPHEQVDCDAAPRVILDVLAVRARLARAVLALPLELGPTAEVILVLEVLAMAGLVQRGQQADVFGDPRSRLNRCSKAEILPLHAEHS